MTETGAAREMKPWCNTVQLAHKLTYCGFSSGASFKKSRLSSQGCEFHSPLSWENSDGECKWASWPPLSRQRVRVEAESLLLRCCYQRTYWDWTWEKNDAKNNKITTWYRYDTLSNQTRQSKRVRSLIIMPRLANSVGGLNKAGENKMGWWLFSISAVISRVLLMRRTEFGSCGTIVFRPSKP